MLAHSTGRYEVKKLTYSDTKIHLFDLILLQTLLKQAF